MRLTYAQRSALPWHRQVLVIWRENWPLYAATGAAALLLGIATARGWL